MTHDVLSTTTENAGSTAVRFVTLDITGTDGTNYENYAVPGDVHGVSVVGQADPAYRVLYDTANERLAVTNADGTAFAATGEAVGEVTLRVESG